MRYLPPDLRPTLLLRRTRSLLDGMNKRPETRVLAPPLAAAHERLAREHADRDRRHAARDETRNDSNLAELDLRDAIQGLHALALQRLIGSDRRCLFPRGLTAETRPAGPSLVEGCQALLRRLDALHPFLRERLAPGRAELEHRVSRFEELLRARERASAELTAAFQQERAAALALTSAAHRAREQVRGIDPALLRAICPRNPRRRDADPDAMAG